MWPLLTHRLSAPSIAMALMESVLPGSWMNLETRQSSGAEPETHAIAAVPSEVAPHAPACEILTMDLPQATASM